MGGARIHIQGPIVAVILEPDPVLSIVVGHLQILLVYMYPEHLIWRESKGIRAGAGD